VTATVNFSGRSAFTELHEEFIMFIRHSQLRCFIVQRTEGQAVLCVLIRLVSLFYEKQTRDQILSESYKPPRGIANCI